MIFGRIGEGESFGGDSYPVCPAGIIIHRNRPYVHIGLTGSLLCQRTLLSSRRLPEFIRITLLSTRYRILLPLYAGARHRGIRPADSSRQGVFLICICSVPEEFFPDGKGSSGWAIAFPKGSVVPQVTARRVYTSFPGAPEAPCIPLRSLGLLPVPCPGRSGRFWP